MPPRPAYRLPPLMLGVFLLELLILLISIPLVARTYLDSNPALRPYGQDWVYLTASGGYTREIFLRSGAIPLWNPFVGSGEPMLEGVLSFVLNPFMSVPILLRGVVDGGKAAIVLHQVIMAFGGWTLARVLRLRAPGRVLVGLLCLGAGGFTAAIGEGHFQIGLSQAYVPYILAGLIGVLYLPRRWPIGLLAVSTFLMLSAGSNWYVLTIAITCALVAGFAVWTWRADRRFPLRLNRVVVRRLLIATFFVLTVAAIRLVAQVIAVQNLAHPPEQLTYQYSFAQLLEVYFQPTAGVAGTSYWLRYVYIFPGALLIILGALWLILRPSPQRLDAAWLTILLPFSLAILLWSVLALGGTDFVRTLYRTVPLLYSWRRLGRFAAAALPLIAVLIALLFDTVVWRSLAWARGEAVRFGLPFIAGLRRGLALSRPLGQAMTVLIIALGGLGALDVLQNWSRVTRLFPVDQHNGLLAGVSYLRYIYPSRFLAIDTLDMAPTTEFFGALARTTVGNPEIVTLGRPATLASVRMDGAKAAFAAGYNVSFLNSRYNAGYEPAPDAPRFGAVSIAYENPDALPFAFTFLAARESVPAPFFPDEVTPQTFYHRIDTIQVNVAEHPEGAVLAVQETAYPGWRVTVDGVPLFVESVGGVIGVRLPGTGPATVVFTYLPDTLIISALVSLVGSALIAAWLLRLDEHLARLRRSRQSRALTRPPELL